jgi:hypothetical protein
MELFISSASCYFPLLRSKQKYCQQMGVRERPHLKQSAPNIQLKRFAGRLEGTFTKTRE